MAGEERLLNFQMTDILICAMPCWILQETVVMRLSYGIRMKFGSIHNMIIRFKENYTSRREINYTIIQIIRLRCHCQDGQIKRCKIHLASGVKMMILLSHI